MGSLEKLREAGTGGVQQKRKERRYGLSSMLREHRIHATRALPEHETRRAPSVVIEAQRIGTGEAARAAGPPSEPRPANTAVSQRAITPCAPTEIAVPAS